MSSGISYGTAIHAYNILTHESICVFQETMDLFPCSVTVVNLGCKTQTEWEVQIREAYQLIRDEILPDQMSRAMVLGNSTEFKEIVASTLLSLNLCASILVISAEESFVAEKYRFLIARAKSNSMPIFYPNEVLPNLFLGPLPCLNDIVALEDLGALLAKIYYAMP